MGAGNGPGDQQKADLIDLLAGTDPRVLVPQVEAAKKGRHPGRGLPLQRPGAESRACKQRRADRLFKAGQLLADWAIVQTAGKLNSLVLISTGPLSTDSMMAGIEEEFKKCPDCKKKVINVPVVDWGTRIQPNVQSALLADPSVNYIIIIYDSMAQFVVPAVTIAGAEGRVKMNAFNGTPFVLGLVQQARSRWISARTWTGSATP